MERGGEEKGRDREEGRDGEEGEVLEQRKVQTLGETPE